MLLGVSGCSRAGKGVLVERLARSLGALPLLDYRQQHRRTKGKEERLV